MADDEEEHRKTCWDKCVPKLLRDRLFAGRRPPPNRKVYVDNKLLPGEDTMELYNYPHNRVVSSKYTFLTFLPKNLFEQFRRIANFYFLCVALTQFMIDTPVTPITSVLPLLFVISITAIKQGYEDYLRHNADKEVNLRPTVIIRNGQVQRGLRAMDVKVGDIVKTYINEEFPCDMILLSSEDRNGHCFITTANLDGETNLKTHYSQQETRKLRTPQALGTLRASITCKPQTADLYTFHGVMHFGHDADPQPLGPEHLLLRGARLKNTPWVYGCAIYTGKETKMALNSTAKKAKFSRVERKLNTFLILFLVILILSCVVPTAFKYWFKDKEGDTPWYFREEDHDDYDASSVFETGLAFMVLVNYIIPISLYVTIEMQKFFGSLFFNYDVEMYDEDLNEPATANTSDLNEELGQVEYLFTDKTGTLTENTMTFRKCVIGKRCFEEVNGMLCEVTGDQIIPVTDPSFQNPPEQMTDFLRVLVLCHTVRVDRQYNPRASTLDDLDNENFNANSPSKWRRWHQRKLHSSRDSLDSYYDHQEEVINNRSNNARSVTESEYSETGQDYEYQASSPDEKAFVEACCKYGTIYHGLVDDIHEVSYRQEMHRFKLLETLPFDAVRKRMSVIIRDAEGDIFLLCKGAEIAIFDRVIEGDIEITQKHIDEYALNGYRTLCLARRKLTEEEYQELSEKLAEARLSLVDRDAKVAEVYNECESNLTLLGATAVEDKLQDDVPQTINALRQAGIKVWVLTGDKEETAVNISHSAGHFASHMTELRLTQVSSQEQCYEQLLHLLEQVRNNAKRTKVEYSLTVDGKSLAFALRKHPVWLRELCSYCVAVLCCRMSPIQKAEVVNLIKKSPEQPVTAAIGDGANDVSMIQEADVGFGIMGKEGRQAVCNSDYAFGKFRFLRRALLLHGHFYYHRLAVLVKYFFYKNVAWVTCQIYFAIFSYWSQQSLYDPFYLTFYNMTSTSLPILIYGIFEQCKPKEKLMDQPHLYKSIARNASLCWSVFLEWMILALWHSLVFFFSVYLLEDDNTSLFSSGYSIGVYDFGTIIAYAGIIAVNIKLMIETYYWCWQMAFAYFFTAAGTILMAVVYTNVFWPSWVTDSRDLYGVPAQLYDSAAVWLCLLVTIIASLLPDLTLRAVRDTKAAVEDFKYENAKNKSFSDQSGSSKNEVLHNSDVRGLPSPSWTSLAATSGTTNQQHPSLTSSKSRPDTSNRITLLHDMNGNFNYGTTGRTMGGFDNLAMSVDDLTQVPAVATVDPGQKQERQRDGSDETSISAVPNLGYSDGSASIDAHDSARAAHKEELSPSPESTPVHGLDDRTSRPPAVQNDETSRGQFSHSPQDPFETPTNEEAKISTPVLSPLPPLLLSPAQVPVSISESYQSRDCGSLSNSEHERQVVPAGEGRDDLKSAAPSYNQPVSHPPLSNSLSSAQNSSPPFIFHVPIPPISTSSSPPSQPPQPSTSLLTTQQPLLTPISSMVTPDLSLTSGQNNPAFSLASENTPQNLPQQQNKQGEKQQGKHVTFIDVVENI